MNFGSAEMPYVTPTGTMSRDLSHEIRTPLAVIRMQAQLLLRSARRGAFAGNLADHERLTTGLQRIEDAVAKLSAVLDRVADEGADDRRALSGRLEEHALPDIH